MHMMKQPPDVPWILNCVRPPALYTRFLVVHRLGLRDEDAVSQLVERGLLEPLGQRTGKKQMLFFGDEIEERAHDRRWLERVVKVLKGPEDPGDGKKESRR